MEHYPERKIRLKEHQRGQRWEATVSEYQRSLADATLGPGPFVMEVDSDGFVSSAFEKSDDLGDIIVLGDSIPENTFVPAEKRLCRMIELALREQGHRVRVLNGGVSGASSLHTLNVIASKVLALKPKLILVMNGTIDTECAIETSSFWTKHEYFDPFTYGYVDVDHPYIEERQSPDFEDRKRILRSMVYLANQFGIPVAFSTSHHRLRDGDELMQRIYSDERYAERLSRWKGTHKATRDVCSELRVPLLDVHKKFSGRSDLLYDDIHMNEHGAREVGRWMAGELGAIFERSAKKTRGAAPIERMRNLVRTFARAALPGR
ncbi:SGNH/GDSL hydrolase family protein [Burkholderia sp. Ac-20349]|uniref:SGNH/GDSL hydrolase family protein n=1 Tax=Burkholderia sp. Ac-20349 TaxID=2703893 RepID=UPI00197C35EF|nr:SGNH/GDSL hydrolase family protein [Burkholderia sp. Ac-20349]MBN3839326.1 SGNH/GDSL hydrolase family protein [Burkholderia sp. Ac-20349]